MYLAVVLGYYFVFEVTVGQTLGKQLLGLQGHPCRWQPASCGGHRRAHAAADRGLAAVSVPGRLHCDAGHWRAAPTAGRPRGQHGGGPGATGGRRGLALVPLALVAALLALTGYAASVPGAGAKTIDPAKIEDTLDKDMKEKNPGLRVGAVACPDGIKTVEGATFQCTAEVEGVQAPISVTVTEADASRGTFKIDWKPTKALLAVDQVVKHLQDQAPNATVNCGTAPVRVVEVGGAIECIISEGSNRLVVRGVVEDLDGNVRFEQQD